MNRRHIGFGVLVAGAAGLAARRKLRRQLDSGAPESVEPQAATTVASDEPSPARDVAATSADTADLTPTPEPSMAEQEPTVPEPLSSGGLIEPAGSSGEAGSLSSASLLDQAPTTLGSPEIGDPEISSEVAIAPDQPKHGQVDPPVAEAETKERQQDATPSIVLPTMPPAGTIEAPGDTAIVVPKADGSQSTISPTQPVAEVSLPAAPISSTEPAPPVVKPSPINTPLVEDPPSPAPPGGDTGSASTASPFSLSDADIASAKSDKPPVWRRRVGGWSILSLALLTMLGVGAFVASVVRLPYYRLQPGSVYDTIERVEAPGDLVFVPDGEIGFVTVSQTANITPWQWLDAQLDENIRIRHEDEVRGEQTADEARANDLRRMQVSKNSAVVVALQKLGYELIITPIGVEVAQVFDCTAADGTLGTGDLIVAVNGVPTPDGERLVEQLISAGIGQEVELLVERIDPNNPTQSMRTDLVGLTLGSADDPCLDETIRGEEPRPFIGIGTQTMYEEDLPIDIDVRTGRVGGPSAGLAFTLAIMDVLSDGELTNGLNIVATGSIDRDGRVGPVGGIHQKTIAAERSGADIFLVPACCDNFVDRTSGDPLDLPSNFDVAQEHADEMLVVGVENIDDALRAIAELGGDVEDFLEP